MTDSWNSIDSVEKDKFLFGQNSNELVISDELFNKYKDFSFWKVELIIDALYAIGGVYIDVNSIMILSIIKTPFNGNCFVQPDSGYALVTDFLIECVGWIDVEGGVTNYFFFGNFIYFF